MYYISENSVSESIAMCNFVKKVFYWLISTYFLSVIYAIIFALKASQLSFDTLIIGVITIIMIGVALLMCYWAFAKKYFDFKKSINTCAKFDKRYIGYEFSTEGIVEITYFNKANNQLSKIRYNFYEHLRVNRLISLDDWEGIYKIINDVERMHEISIHELSKHYKRETNKNYHEKVNTVWK